MSNIKEQHMLKYQKAKVKLIEYDVPLSDYPSFPLNYHELAYPTVFYISEYSDAVINNDIIKQQALEINLSICAEYYDAALRSREQSPYDIDFLLSGAVAYFYKKDFGSASVMLKGIDELNIVVPDDLRGALTDILFLILTGRRNRKTHNSVADTFEKYIETDNDDCLEDIRHTYINSIRSDNDNDAFFAEAIYAISLIVMQNIARKLLPVYSGLSSDDWIEYFKSQNSIRMIWPAQRLLGNQGIFKGKNAVVQLPTGVGKTKSVELIIRSMFLSNRGSTALIVAPLRALCNEITHDLQRAFLGELSINQFSDLLELDFGDVFLERSEKKILICTPEKLQFISHHKNDIFNCIDLFVFDEGHMFDDMSRGALYEMLVLSIKEVLSDRQQMVIMSAVLSNAEQITNWVLGDNGVFAYDNRIESTPKVTGFVSSDGKMHYYSDSFKEEDFFVPKAIKIQRLVSKKKNTNPKMFPEYTSKDIALYFANCLCESGGVAVYVSQIRNISSIMKRASEVSLRGGNLSHILTSSNLDEVEKLKKFICEYYGDSSEYVSAAELGVFPHYSYLPNGLRMSIEHAYRNNQIKVVVCTSTLAQGVNIPIKYLIMTSLKVSTAMIKTRNFQNLIGRTARSGVYTEGSIIISDPNLFDNKDRGKGNYDWDNTIKMFNSENSEACGSAILALVQDFVIDYETKISGKTICKFMIEYTDSWFDTLFKGIITFLEQKNKSDARTITRVENQLKCYKVIVGNIENSICAKVSNRDTSQFSEEAVMVAANETCIKTLAYYLASDEERGMLTALFTSLGKRIAKNKPVIYLTSNSLVDIDSAVQILNYIDSMMLNIEVFDYTHLLEMSIELYSHIYGEGTINHGICTRWISGKTFYDISQELQIKILDVEKQCENAISYQLSFLLGNLIDYLDESSPNIEKLMVLQKQVKYGVESQTAISICEKIFNERIIANKITVALNNMSVTSNNIIEYIKLHKRKVIEAIHDYPSFFSDRLRLM